MNGMVFGSRAADRRGRGDLRAGRVGGRQRGDVGAQVIVAAAQGLAAAGQINMDLVIEETQAAVAARAAAGAA